MKMLKIKRTWILAGLIAVSAVSAGANVANAGSVGLRATINPLGGDPPWLYTISVALTSSGTFANGSTISVSELVGTDNTSLVTLPPENGTTTNPVVWAVTNIDTISSGRPFPYNFESTFTWTYQGPTMTYVDNDPSNNNLGSFTIQTSPGLSFPVGVPPVKVGSVLDTVITVVDGNGNSTTTDGTVTVTLAVPEPSSLSLLLIGGAVAAVLGRSGNRSRLQRV
jgi:PEP-CTERM motif